MFRLSTLLRLAALTTAVAAVSCSSDKNILGPDSPPGGEIFKSYVAMGNSITAGWQSDGINDSTQRQSYARLLATSMGTQYHYASFAMPGCTPPLTNLLTGARVLTGLPAGATTPPPCALRNAASITDVLNNVAVPDAYSADPTAVTSFQSNALTTFILGGLTQTQRALVARPTFATIWIGNNDILGALGSGILVPTPALGQRGFLTTPAQFQANYDAMLAQLVAGAPGIKGVLIGLIQAPNVPRLVTGDTLFRASAANRTSMATLAGLPATPTSLNISGNCAGSTVLVNIYDILPAIKAGRHPNFISCVKNVPAAPVGDVFVLDDAEQVAAAAQIDAINSYLASKAAAIGFAYVDPNAVLQPLRASNAIPRLPNFTSGTAPFGTYISIDGVHPAAPAHVLIANLVIGATNAKYGTSLATQ